MVFSQTSHKTQTVLKVVDLDRLKPEKSQQVNSATGVVSDGHTESMPSSPVPTTSYIEKYLKPVPLAESKMFHDTDCEFFQDLVQWCSAPAKEELVQTIDSPKKPEERAYNIDTPHTPFSPQGWDALDANSPYNQADFYNYPPVNPLSPNNEGFTFNNILTAPTHQNQVQFQEKFLDISSLPVVIGDVASDQFADTSSWPTTEPVEWTNLHDTTNYTKQYRNTMPFIDQEDSLDSKFVSVIPREVESNDVVITEYIIKDDGGEEGQYKGTGGQNRVGGLSVDVLARAPSWPNEVISTPEVLSYVEELETEKCSRPVFKPTKRWPVEEAGPELRNSCTTSNMSVPSIDYEPITPKSEFHADSDHDDVKSPSSKRRHQDSEDEDETYTPCLGQTPRKNKRRKSNIPIKDMILALEGSQNLTKARRGRPPKRRESTVSSVCSVDETSSTISTQETKYRELRDKNNEASKRSRMNRKLKELQMEQMADELEERNKKLKVKADILEEITKKLKDALMTAILHK